MQDFQGPFIQSSHLSHIPVVSFICECMNYVQNHTIYLTLCLFHKISFISASIYFQIVIIFSIIETLHCTLQECIYPQSFNFFVIFVLKSRNHHLRFCWDNAWGHTYDIRLRFHPILHSMCYPPSLIGRSLSAIPHLLI